MAYDITTIRAVFEIVVAIIVILGAVRSAYKGIIHDIWLAIKMIPKINRRTKQNSERVEQIDKDTQRRHSEVTQRINTLSELMVAYVEYDQKARDNGFDVEQMREEVDVEQPRSSYYNEDARWRSNDEQP